MRAAIVALVVLALAALVPATAGAQRPDLTIVPIGVPLGADVPEVASRQPPFAITADFTQMAGAAGVVCAVDVTAAGPYTPCGTQVTAGCSASQCWTYTPTLTGDGQHQMWVELVDAAGNELDTLGFQFTVDSTPPDTTLLSGPVFDSGDAAANGIPYSFDYRTVDDADPISYEDTAQCATTTGTAPPAKWGACGTEDQPARLPLSTRIYRFWVRAVDFLGRPDPTPAESAPFSPIPCHATLARHAPTLPQIIRHGLRVKVTCVQPGTVELDLQLSTKELNRINQKYRNVSYPGVGRRTSAQVTRQGGSTTVTIRALHGLPRNLIDYPHLVMQLVTTQGGAGSSFINTVR